MNIVASCSKGHEQTRPFAQYCTQCGVKLQKPVVWGMAYGNEYRTATHDCKETLNIPNSWSRIPAIDGAANLPGMLAIDGHIVLPNPKDNTLDVYELAQQKPDADADGIQLRQELLGEKKQSIRFSTPLTHSCTPISHGFHLFYVTPEGLRKTSLLDGASEAVAVNGVPPAAIDPLPHCAPLKCEIDGEPILIAGLKGGALRFNLRSDKAIYIKDSKFFDGGNVPLSPVICGPYIVFTAKQGHIFFVDTGFNKSRLRSFDKLSFSAPVSVGGKVYFEVLSGTARSLARCTPETGTLSKVRDIDDKVINPAPRLALYSYPPLTDGQQLFLSDSSGTVVYTFYINAGYINAGNFMSKQPLGDGKARFVPHLSVATNSRIYSAHSSGLTTISFKPVFVAVPSFLAGGGLTNPVPVAPPLRYGDKLFILCKDRLICWNI